MKLRVEGDIRLGMIAVAEINSFYQFIFVEIFCVFPGVKGPAAEIDRIRTSAHSRFEAGKVAGRRQQFCQNTTPLSGLFQFVKGHVFFL